MTENLLTTVMLTLLAVELVGLYVNGIVVRRNYRIHEDEVKSLKNQLDDAMRANKEWSKTFRQGDFMEQGFIVTPDGSKFLPKGWRDALAAIEKKN